MTPRVGALRTIDFARLEQLLVLLILTFSAVLITLAVRIVLETPYEAMVDANTYLAAGERLNQGHALYALVDGDRWVNVQNGIPLVSPPFVAVLWRPLAALGSWTMIPWTVLTAAGALATVYVAFRANRLLTALLVLFLWQSLVWTLVVGNVNGLFMAATVFIGLRPRWAAVVIGVMAAIKVWPMLLAIAVVRSRRQFLELAGTLAACAAIALLGAGWQAHVEYLSVIGKMGTYDTSLGYLTAWWVPWAVLVIGSVLAIGSYRSAVVTSILANPALHSGSWITILPAVAHNVIADRLPWPAKS